MFSFVKRKENIKKIFLPSTNLMHSFKPFSNNKRLTGNVNMNNVIKLSKLTLNQTNEEEKVWWFQV